MQKEIIMIVDAHVSCVLVKPFSPTIGPDITDQAYIAGLIAPIFEPLGLGDWRIVTSLISGFMAKESVVSVLEVLFSAQGGVNAVLAPLAAGTLLVFSLLYTPCVAAVAAVKRELGAKWAVYVVVWQCAVAWIVALLFFT